LNRSSAGLLGRVSIASRLVGLAVVLVGLMLGTNLYLMRALDRAAAAAVASERLTGLVNASHAVGTSFGNLRYWLTDLAVSQLTLSERNAGAARDELKHRLDLLAVHEPELTAAIRREVDGFDTLAMDAVDAYTDDQRVIGNTRLAAARAHGQQVDALLENFALELGRREQAVRDAVVAASATATQVTLTLILLAILLASVLTILVLRSILLPLRQLVTAIEATGRGDLDATVPPQSSDELGALTRAVLLFREGLVERARLEQEAEAQRRLVIDAIECINEGFVLYDAQDRMVLRNTNFVQHQPGLADLMVPGMAFRDFVQAAVARGVVELDGQDADAWVTERLRQHQEPQGALVYRFAGRWVQIGERRTSDGGTVAIYSDITDLRHRQEALEVARQEAVTASQVKSEFLANMSHELRTPLNAIIGYSQLLQEDAADAGDETSLPDLKKIENAGKHLLGLINDILDLSKIEAGRMDLFIEAVDVPALVEDVRLMVEPLAARNSNTLLIDCPASIGAIRSDSTKLKQSLLNLLSNACKFTDHGNVSLVARQVRGGMIEFAVGDTGIGMTEQQMERLFQAFVQADNSTTRRFGGTGLGLAITRSFARLLGGDVSVSSRAGEGSVFRLTLPTDQAASVTRVGETEGREAASDSARAHILVIDDDLAARQIIGAHLAREGYRVSYAGSGAEGLEMARAEQPDAITLDILMPQIDGWSVLTSLKHDPALCSIPVVLVSIAGDKGLAFSLGAAALLAKPVDRAELVGALQSQLQTRTGGVVLVVEDDPPMRELTERTVVSLGHQCTSVGNGREALAWLAANAVPVLIVLDLLMPEMDGFEFLTRLREQPAWHDVPVIVVTALQIEESQRQTLEAMTQQIVAKGHSAHRELSRAVRELLTAGGG
jgi:signal transduction histidine kinase/DNA-binding response OmpR family regulator/HAMP domain-containing protein